MTRLSGTNEFYDITKADGITHRAPIPVNKPRTPSSEASLIKREEVPSPGRALVLLILDKRVSAGWEMIAAAKPAMRPDAKLRVVTVLGASSSLVLPVAAMIFS